MTVRRESSPIGAWAPFLLTGAVGAGLLLGACATPAPSSDDFIDVPGLGQTRVDVPRPRTGGAACTLALRPGEPVAERAAALREVGLFAHLEDLSDEALGDALEAELVAEWGQPIPDDDLLQELFVAALDSERAWWGDLEADVGPGGDVYVSVLEEWAAISVGSFTPQAIEESWASATGPVTVRFTLRGQDVQLEPAYLEDWIDPGIIAPINELIAPSGRQFALVSAFDQTAFLLALDEGERSALEARGWCFE